MKILALDPSSTRTGYAVMTGAESVEEAGYLRPSRTRDKPEARIDAMCDDLGELLETHKPQRAVIEVPSGRPGKGAKRGATGQLATYGVAVGELRRVCKDMLPALQTGSWSAPLVKSVTEREWTHGRTQASRRRWAASVWPAYRESMAKDSGADVADALLIGEWWFNQLAATLIETCKLVETYARQH